jgi:hypothetical protein
MGGSDDEDNLVELTPEEHYVAHQLLVKMYPDNYNLSHAANMMGSIRANNKLYGWLRKRLSRSMSVNNPNAGGHARREYNKKYGSPNIGHRHSEETKRLLSEGKKGDKNPNADGQVRRTKTRVVSVKDGTEYCFNSLKEAEAAFNANHAGVWQARKEDRPYKGYYWYVGE